MIEYNSETANKLEEIHPTIAVPVVLTYEELQTKAADLESKVELLRDSVETWRQNYYDSQDTIAKAEKGFREILAGDVDASDIIETYGEVFTKHFGWLFSREVEIEISVTWRGTIELPHDIDVTDLDIDDFGIEISGHSEYESEIRSHFESYSIDER